jgi:isochorismate hydrolase
MDLEGIKLMAFYDSVAAYKGILADLMNKQPLNIKDLKAENTALVIIDMVNGFCRKGNLYSPRVEFIIDNVVRTFNICKDKGMQIIAFADSHTESSPELAAYPEHCMKGT